MIERLGVTVLCQAPTEYRLMAKLDELDQLRPVESSDTRSPPASLSIRR